MIRSSRFPWRLVDGVFFATMLAVPQTRDLLAQKRPPQGPAKPYTTVPAEALATFDSAALAGVRWREIGPYRGGRSVIAVGSVARPNEYYMGTVGGGVFKTVDGGNAWFPVTDKYFGGTIGGIAVAPSSPDVVYVGGGEYPLRGNVSHGDGVWKSVDAGKTWSYVGLAPTRQIGDIVVNPTNPDLVYVAALGHVWAPNPERGVFRSRDGGKSWDKILFRNDSTGAVRLVMDPNNPNVLYAGLWQAGRTPWLLSSGGAGSGLFKTTDGGDHWTEITRNTGLPAGIWGNIGIDVSQVSSSRVFALIEAQDGGVYRSDDAGSTWKKLNTENALKQRAWYYMRIHADPKDSNAVYVNNVSFMKSTDGGKTFHAVRGLHHGDSHHLWIAPNDNKRMIETDDGGAEVSTDGGKTWTEEDFATAQFYHVTTTTHFPYHVCGAQQDNSTMCGPSRSPSGAIDINEWQEAGGGESGWIAARADEPDIVYAGSYGNLITRKDMHTGLTRNINPWPDNPMGHPARDLRYRFQWTFPILVSPHNSNVVYVGSNVVHKTTNGGQSWTVISPDLTRHDPRTQGNSGGPLTLDQTSVEYYGTVFVINESPRRAGLLWTGSDDGKVYVTRDGGTSWADATPKDIPEWTRISSIDASAFDDGTAYVAGNRFQLDDDRPYLWKTADFGKTWTRIDEGISPTEFTRVVREDPERRGLLFAGTERGVWFSVDDGKHWQRLQLNLPPAPVHDLTIKEGDLVIATHGRSFYIMDDISSLRQLSDAVVASDAHLFKPLDAYRVQWGGSRGGRRAQQPTEVPVHPVGENPASGVIVQYWLKHPTKDVTLEFLDGAGKLIRSFDSRQDSTAAADSVRREAHRASRTDSLRAAGLSQDSLQKLMRSSTDAPSQSVGDEEEGFRPTPPPRVPDKAGVNTFVWNMRYPEPSAFRGMILWAAGVVGPTAPPGAYSVRMLVGGKPVAAQSFRIIADPRARAAGVTQADYTEQFALLTKIRDRFSETNDAVKSIRYVRYQLDQAKARIPAAQQADFAVAATGLDQALTSVEDSLYQTKNRANEDPLNFPIRLNNKIGGLMGVVGGADGRPTAQSYAVFSELSTHLDRELGRMKRVLDAMLPRVNSLLKAAGQPALVIRPVELPVEKGEGVVM